MLQTGVSLLSSTSLSPSSAPQGALPNRLCLPTTVWRERERESERMRLLAYEGGIQNLPPPPPVLTSVKGTSLTTTQHNLPTSLARLMHGPLGNAKEGRKREMVVLFLCEFPPPPLYSVVCT